MKIREEKRSVNTGREKKESTNATNIRKGHKKITLHAVGIIDFVDLYGTN